MTVIDYTFYSHTDKDSNWEQARELGLSEKASRQFVYCGYEISFKGSLNTETGEFLATHVNGVALTAPTPLT